MAAYEVINGIEDLQGSRKASNTIEVPVALIDSDQCLRRYCFGRSERYSLALFDFDQDTLDHHQQRVVREYIGSRFDELRDAEWLRVDITGYADRVEGEADAQQLTERRAESMGAILEPWLPIESPATGSSVKMQGIGATSPLYSNALPEGRFFNRTVQVVIDLPTDWRPAR